jgi:hypothetical protein
MKKAPEDCFDTSGQYPGSMHQYRRGTGKNEKRNSGAEVFVDIISSARVIFQNIT